MNSPVLSHSALYGVQQKELARYEDRKNFELQHRTDSRRTLNQPPGTTTNTDEDRLTLGEIERAAPLQLLTP